ncbi:hypothetical protein [Pseudomonas sp. Fl4BN1]|uniref:hypothetical protein n=1 Tax=Pseudomonas sp. Fl4BN1 TaxID=2697651 RepID=UPI0013766016|nr:hypothetical protein [Pseudomonas sp. Fl4BN1]NBF09994.1 hypothetical protein [Pseudomonas sp. Fl4BN1]
MTPAAAWPKKSSTTTAFAPSAGNTAGTATIASQAWTPPDNEHWRYEYDAFGHHLRKFNLTQSNFSSEPQYPRILAENDSDKIKESKMLFARKISKDASPDFMMSFIQK